MIKNKMKQSFDKAVESYDCNCDVQAKSSEDLVNMIPQMKQLDCVLDVGCGTGITSYLLHKKFPYLQYDLCDISDCMLKKAHEKMPSANLILCDAEKYNFKKYDLVISNLALQWFENLHIFIQKISSCCDTFVFSTLIDGSFIEYRNIFSKHDIAYPGLSYISEGSLISICNQYGKLLNTQKSIYIKKFQSAMDAARYFKKIGASASNYQSPNIALCIKNYYGEMSLNYDVMFCVIKFC